MFSNAISQAEHGVMLMQNSPSFHARQQAFGEALRDASLPTPGGILGRGGEPGERRFNVYRNNVVTGQVSTLGDAYPVTARLVGDDFFRAMARDYVLAHPPGTPMMFDYGADFPAFIDVFPAARELPYLGDVARIERAWVEAYHSPEASPLSGLDLRNLLAGSDLRSSTLQLHPAMRVLRSAFPALSIWEVNTGAARHRTIDLDEGPEDVLMVRPIADVQLHRLPEGGATFFLSLSKGCSLVDAAEQAIADDPLFDLIANIAMLVDARLVTGTRAVPVNACLTGCMT